MRRDRRLQIRSHPAHHSRDIPCEVFRGPHRVTAVFVDRVRKPLDKHLGDPPHLLRGRADAKEAADPVPEWKYVESAAYDIDAAAAEAFDRDFPPMEKAYRLSQELTVFIYSHATVAR